MYLPSHLKGVAINWIVPAFNINRALIAMLPEVADQTDPVGIAKTRCAMPSEGQSRPYAMSTDYIPIYLGVFAVDVKNALDPILELWKRVNKTNHLVAWFPLQAERIAWYGIEHHLPCTRTVCDIPVTPLPVAAHVTIFESNSNPMVLCTCGKGAKTCGKGLYRFR